MNIFETAKQITCLDAAAMLGLRTRGSGEKAFTRCPLHGDKTPSLCLYPGDRGFYCFSCHTGGDVIRLVSIFRGCSQREAAKEICDTYGLTWDDGAETYVRGSLSPARRTGSARQTAAARRSALRAQYTRYAAETGSRVRGMQDRYREEGRSSEELLKDEDFLKLLERRSQVYLLLDRLDGMSDEEVLTLPDVSLPPLPDAPPVTPAEAEAAETAEKRVPEPPSA